MTDTFAPGMVDFEYAPTITFGEDTDHDGWATVIKRGLYGCNVALMRSGYPAEVAVGVVTDVDCYEGISLVDDDRIADGKRVTVPWGRFDEVRYL